MLSLAIVLILLISSILPAPLYESIKIKVDQREKNAVTNTNMKWPSGTVPYVISSQYTQTIRSTIIATMREVEGDVNDVVNICVQFIPRTTEINYINIYPGTGCHSDVGMINTGSQDVSIGPGCEVRGVIMHELLHVLGFWHEHSRYDRDNYINIDLTNVIDAQKSNFNKATASMLNTLNTSYDFTSIMHYGPYTLAKNGAFPVITPKPGLAIGVKLGQRISLSDLDVIRIQRWYSCNEDTSHITRTILTDSVSRCDFTSDICNLTQDMSTNLQWAVTQGVSAAGPQAGNTNGADPYLVATATGPSRISRVVTPFFNVGRVCVHFYRFQKGPSYLNMIASGPNIARTVFRSFQGNNVNKWRPAQLGLNVPVGASFQITFEAQVSSGDVAIDDINIYKGVCI